LYNTWEHELYSTAPVTKYHINLWCTPWQASDLAAEKRLVDHYQVSRQGNYYCVMVAILSVIFMKLSVPFHEIHPLSGGPLLSRCCKAKTAFSGTTAVREKRELKP
jgi:hypothetical protein